MQIRRKNRAEVMYTLKRICVGMTKTMLLYCASKPIKTTRTGGNSNFFVRFWKQTLLHDSSPRASSPIWASEASLARTRERAAKLAQITVSSQLSFALRDHKL